MERSGNPAKARVRLTLFGYAPVDAEADLRPRPRSERLTRALLYAGGGIVLAPIVAFIPPHVPWVLASLGAGVYFGRSHWRGDYEVTRFEGTCPACGAAMTLKAGTRVRFPFGVTCMACHRDLTLEAAGD
ncbi:MAG TPA: hypothetical protein VNZ57_14700 [Longimicrobiales bacterium]|nr:hypothetical protein [Longimicrobiales bacterium]